MILPGSLFGLYALALITVVFSILIGVVYKLVCELGLDPSRV